jgi:hypothetical protein
MNPHGAYIHFRPNGEAFYVGKGTKKRAHTMGARNQHHESVVAKHGKENIQISFIPCSTEAVAFELEVGLIKTFIQNGVKLTNMTDGGEGASGHIHNKETKTKLSAANIGKTLTVETRAKISTALVGNRHAVGNQHGVGKVLSTETKAKISAASKGNQYAKGCIASEETKAKISAKLRAYFARLRAAKNLLH